jgi:hypothetical protein
MSGDVLIPAGLAAKIIDIPVHFQTNRIAPREISLTKRILDHDIIDLSVCSRGYVLFLTGIWKHPVFH